MIPKRPELKAYVAQLSAREALKRVRKGCAIDVEVAAVAINRLT